jgi:nitroreductase
MTDQFEENVFQVIYARRSVRTYEDRPVEEEKLVKLLKAGMAAPTACNLQPWEFIVVTDPEELAQLRKSASPYNAPVAVIICANTDNIPWDGEDWKIDCSAAVENMMLAAVAMGLGSVWIGAFDVDDARKRLLIPDHIKVMNMVYFGYPSRTKKPATKYDETAVHWQKYDTTRNRRMRTMDMLMTDGYQDT